MKSREMSSKQFLELLKQQNIQIKDLFQQEAIPITSLIQISTVLNKNLFEYYSPQDLGKLSDPDFYNPFKNKIEKLNQIIQKKSSLLKAQKKYIQSLEALNSVLETDQL